MITATCLAGPGSSCLFGSRGRVAPQLLEETYRPSTPLQAWPAAVQLVQNPSGNNINNININRMAPAEMDEEKEEEAAYWWGKLDQFPEVVKHLVLSNLPIENQIAAQEKEESTSSDLSLYALEESKNTEETKTAFVPEQPEALAATIIREPTVIRSYAQLAALPAHVLLENVILGGGPANLEEKKSQAPLSASDLIQCLKDRRLKYVSNLTLRGPIPRLWDNQEMGLQTPVMGPLIDETVKALANLNTLVSLTLQDFTSDQIHSIPSSSVKYFFKTLLSLSPSLSTAPTTEAQQGESPIRILRLIHFETSEEGFITLCKVLEKFKLLQELSIENQKRGLNLFTLQTFTSLRLALSKNPNLRALTLQGLSQSIPNNLVLMLWAKLPQLRTFNTILDDLDYGHLQHDLQRTSSGTSPSEAFIIEGFTSAPDPLLRLVESLQENQTLTTLELRFQKDPFSYRAKNHSEAYAVVLKELQQLGITLTQNPHFHQLKIRIPTLIQKAYFRTKDLTTLSYELQRLGFKSKKELENFENEWIFTLSKDTQAGTH